MAARPHLRRHICTASAAALARTRSPTTAVIRSASRCAQSQLGMALAAASSASAAARICCATWSATSAMLCAVCVGPAHSRLHGGMNACAMGNGQESSDLGVFKAWNLAGRERNSR